MTFCMHEEYTLCYKKHVVSEQGPVAYIDEQKQKHSNMKKASQLSYEAFKLLSQSNERLFPLDSCRWLA